MELFEKKKNLDNLELKAKFMKLLRAEMNYYEKYFTKNIRNIIERKQEEINIRKKCERDELKQDPIETEAPDVDQGEKGQTIPENNDRNSVTNENLTKHYKKMSQIEKNIEMEKDKFIKDNRKVRKGWFSE